MRKLFFCFSLIYSIIFYNAILEAKPAQLEVQEEQPVDWEKEFIQGNKDISGWFDGFTEGIDLFLVGEKVTKEKNKSSFKIDNTTSSREGEKVSNVTSLSLRPRFQNLEKYFQLKFTTYDEDEDSRGIESKVLRKTQRKKNYGATVGFFRTLGNIKTAFQPRIELQDPLKVSHSLSFESVAELKKFALNPKIEFFADSDKGTGIFHALNFHFYLTQVYSLTLINEFEYQEKLHQLSATNGFAVGQVVNEKSALTYSLLFNSNNRERYHLDGYSASVTWNQLIYKKILDYQLTPHLDFEKKRHYKGQAGLIFNISLNF